LVGITHPQLTFRAGLARLFLGGPALVLLPLLFPRTRPHIWVLAVYLVVAGIEQVLIARGFAGRKRSFVAGLVDLFVLTYLIHLIGSTTSVFAAMYFLVGILNVLVVGLRVGVGLAVLNAVAYDSTVWAEWSGRLSFAPDGPDLTRGIPPTFEAALAATSLVTVLLVASTTVVGMLVHAVRKHERELMAANTRLDDLSQRDPLTGLFNRRQLFARLELHAADSGDTGRVRRPGHQPADRHPASHLDVLCLLSGAGHDRLDDHPPSRQRHEVPVPGPSRLAEGGGNMVEGMPTEGASLDQSGHHVGQLGLQHGPEPGREQMGQTELVDAPALPLLPRR